MDITNKQLEKQGSRAQVQTSGELTKIIIQPDYNLLNEGKKVLF